MKTYAFLTKSSNRVEVKASTPEAGLKKLLSIPYFADSITETFIEYNKDGFASRDAWTTTPGIRKIMSWLSIITIKGKRVKTMKLYYHKTDGGAEYLMDSYIECDNGHREGIFEGAKYVVRLDGDITKDAELSII